MDPILANYSHMTPEQRKLSHATFDDLMLIFRKHLDRPLDSAEGCQRLACVEELHDYVMKIIDVLTSKEAP